MRAVNLTPPDVAGPRSGGATGIAPYALIGVLGIALAMFAMWTVTGRSVAQKHGRLAALTEQAAATERAAADYKTYADFAKLRTSRVETVTKLAATRYDWAGSLHEVARTLPSGSWILSLRATVSPTTPVDGTGDSMRGSLPVPAVELSGCATTQAGVARTIASLRRISGVQRVSLTNSQAAAETGAQADTRAASTTCGTHPQFSLTVFFKAAAASPATTGGTTP
jgi:Tfp pilus assembly protein PilN